MAIFLVIIGIMSVIYGLSSIFGMTKEDFSKDSEMDKKLFSEKTRYFIRRYWAGLQFIAAGLGAIALGFILYFSR